MKKKTIIISAVVLLIIAAVCVVACLIFGGSDFDENYQYDGHSLIGKWREKGYEEVSYISYEFFEDGKVELKEYSYGIELKTTLGTYSVDVNKITVDYELYNGTVEHSVNKFCITDDGELIIIYLSEANQMTEEEMVMVPYDIKFNEDNSDVVGKWEDTENPGEYWTFNKDYTGTVSTEGFSYKLYYSIKDDSFFMAYEFVEGSKEALVEFEYEIDGDKLYLTGDIDGTVIEYTFKRS